MRRSIPAYLAVLMVAEFPLGIVGQAGPPPSSGRPTHFFADDRGFEHAQLPTDAVLQTLLHFWLINGRANVGRGLASRLQRWMAYP